MNDSPVMSADQCAGNLNTATDNCFRRQSRVAAHFVERLAFDEFHDDVEFAFGLANVVDGADVGMRKRRRGARFVKKILTAGGAQTGIFLDDFYGNVALKRFVIGAIDDAHSAFANLCLDTTMAEDLTNHRMLPLRLLFRTSC